MSLTSYRAAPPRDGSLFLIGIVREYRFLLGLAVTYSPTS